MRRPFKCAIAILLAFTILTPLTALKVSAEPAEPTGPAEPTEPPPKAPYNPYDDNGPYGLYDDMPIWEQWGLDSPDEFIEMIMRWYDPGLGGAEDFWEPLADSKEEFMYYFDVSEEEYAMLEEAWLRVRESLQNQYRDKLIELGGTPGITNVMYNGRFIEFPGAVPIINEGMAFVPTKEFFGIFGAKLAYDDLTQTITVDMTDKSLEFTIGWTTMGVTVNGEMFERSIGAAPYIADGVSYIPVRGVTRVLGMDVYWDRLYSAIVIIDREKIIKEANESFTIINSLFDIQFGFEPTEGVSKTVLDLVLSTTEFNSIDGDMDVKLDGNITIISDGLNFSLTGTVDLSELFNLLLADAMLYGLDDVEELEEMLEMFELLRDIKIEIILNYDEDVLYIRMPILFELILGEFLPDIPENAWIALPGATELVDALGLGSLLDMFGLDAISGASSIGEMIFPPAWSRWSYSYLDMYDEIMQEIEFNIAVFGDDRFTEVRGGYHLSMTLEEYNELSRKYDQGNYYTEFNIDLTVKRSGTTTTGASGSIIYREGSWSWDTRTTLELDISSDRIKFSMEVHERNSSRVVLSIDMSTTSVAEPVPSAPPAGDKVISIEDILGPIFGSGPDVVEPLRFVP